MKLRQRRAVATREVRGGAAIVLAVLATSFGLTPHAAHAAPGLTPLRWQNAAQHIDGVNCIRETLDVVGGAKLIIDGGWGPTMVQAVKNFQRFWGLTVDGVVGPKTGDMLFATWVWHFNNQATWKLDPKYALYAQGTRFGIGCYWVIPTSE